MALVAVSCGEEEDPVVEVEAGVAAVLAERLGSTVEAVTVDCPADAALEEGAELACAVSVAGDDAVDLRLVIGPAGSVELTRAVVPTDDAEAYLVGQLTRPAEGPVDVDCGEQTLVVRDVGETFPCEVRRQADGATFDVTVTVFSLDGQVRHRVEPTTTTTPLAAPPATVAPP
ncbi:MAG: DUF4333 domain-containing protein [Actinomycetota bacterium]|nr:DUF4333 domain-containing protein [Actinomycetota bacterium]